MNVSEMIDLIGVKCDDITPATFPVPIRYTVLNEAMKKIINVIDNYYLNSIVVKAEDKALDSDGVFDLSTLTLAPYSMGNGVMQVVALADTPFPLRKVSYEQYINLVENGFVEYDDADTLLLDSGWYYILGSLLYCNPKSYDVDIIYLKTPATISKTVECDLDDHYHYDLVSLASAMLLNDKKLEYSILTEIETMSMRSRATDSNQTNEGYNSDPLRRREVIVIAES